MDEVSTYLCEEFGETLHPNLAEWLRDLCSGQPRWIHQYVNLLKDNNIIGSADGRYKLNGQIKHTSE